MSCKVKTGTKDTGYAFVIILVSFLAHSVVWGILWTIGIWNTVFLEAFGESVAYTSVIGSGINCINYVAGLAGSVLQMKYGSRPIVVAGSALATVGFLVSSMATSIEYLFFSFSICIGCGLGVTYIPSIVIIEEYFEKRRTIAFGMSVAGVGFGMLCYPPINILFLKYLDWRGAMLANVGLTLLLCCCGLLMTPFQQDEPSSSSREMLSTAENNDDDEEEEELVVEFNVDQEIEEETLKNLDKKEDEKQDDDDDDNLLVKMWKSKEMFSVMPYTMFCLNNVVVFFSLTIVWVHMNGHIKDAGLGSEGDAARIYCVIGVSNAIGRVLLGFLCQHPKVPSPLVYTICIYLLAITQVSIPFAASYTAIVIVCVIFGFLSAACGTLLPDIMIEFLGKERLGIAYGFLLIFEGTGSLLGPPAAGYLFQMTRNYDCSFYLAAGCFVLGGIIMTIPLVLIARAQRRPGYNRNQSAISNLTTVTELAA